METKTIKRDVYSIVTDRIIEKLEQGTVPWRQPWQDAGLPQNLITKRAYRGINVMLLASLGYEKNLFLTFNQLKALGGSIKQNEKANLVVFWKWLKNTDEVQADNAEVKKIPYLRYYNVFNVSQCEGIPSSLVPEVRITTSPIAECEKVVNEMPVRPVVQHKEPRAYYSPQRDVVNMPSAYLFESDESYYATLFHELIHSTGHPSRCNRKDFERTKEFGSDLYSFEELVAEIGSCYLQSFTGIASKQFDCSIGYLKGWLKKLKDDKRFIVRASALAQKATDFILNVKLEEIDADDSLQHQSLAV